MGFMSLPPTQILPYSEQRTTAASVINFDSLIKKVFLSIGHKMASSLLLVLMSLALVLGMCLAIVNEEAKNEVVNAHLIPHSHCDVGWKKTVQEYFDTEVHTIITNVVDSLKEDSTKRFIWVEIAYLQLWWGEATEYYRSAFIELVESGSIELVLGGIVMHDESIVYFSDAVDQLSEGHLWIKDTFGDKYLPKVGWQIDPFGSSSLSPTLFSLSCFDYLIINRIDYRIKQKLMNDKGLEFLWQSFSSASQKNYTAIMTHILDHHYSAPLHFDWESDKPWNNPVITEANVNQSSHILAATLKQRADLFRTNTLLVPFGDDFRFQNASAQFENMDMLMKYINARPAEFDVKLKYSTLSEYVSEQRKTEAKYPTKTSNDFFVYIDHPHHCWSGYYTSWPYLKSYIRSRSALLRVVDTLYASFLMRGYEWPQDTSPYNSMLALRKAVAILQHHDAITGTSPRHTRDNYMEMLYNGTVGVIPWIEKFFGEILAIRGSVSDEHASNSNFKFDDGWIFDSLSGGNTVAIPVYNSIERERIEWVEVKGVTCNTVVVDSKEMLLESDIFQCVEQSDKCPANQCTIHFKVHIPPIGIATVFLKPSNKAIRTPSTECAVDSHNSVILENSLISVKIDANTGLLQAIKEKGKVDMTLNQSIVEYIAAMYENAGDNVYVFNATGAGKTKQIGDNENCTCEIGKHISRLYRRLTEYLWQRLTLYPGEREIAVDWIVGPCPLNREITVRLDTGINNENQTLYTDEYGIYMTKRQLPDEFDRTMECSFFPVTDMAYIEDEYSRLSLFTEFSHGVGSLHKGSMEMMIVRNSLEGVWNNDTTVTNQRVWIGYDNVNASENVRFHDMLRHTNPPVTVGYESSFSISDYLAKYRPTWQFLKQDFPSNVHLLSLKSQSASNNNVITRFIHTFQSGSVSMCVERDYFSGTGGTYTETVLTSAKGVNECDRMVWQKDKNEDYSVCEFNVKLDPMAIKTYVIHPKNVKLEGFIPSNNIASYNTAALVVEIVGGLAIITALTVGVVKRKEIRMWVKGREKGEFMSLNDE